MKQIDFSKYGGFPLTQPTLDFLQKSFSEPLLAMAKVLGDKVIIDGINIGATSVSDGWFIYGGEIIKFNACALINNAKVNITQPLQSVLFQDGLTKAVYKEKQGVLDANVGSFFFNEFVRLEDYLTLQTKVSDLMINTWRVGDVKEVDCTMAYFLTNFDNTGLGINERVGWAYCNGNNGTKDRRDKTSICFDDRTIDPNNGIWDTLYNQLGLTVGSKQFTITQSNLPNINLDIKGNRNEGGGGHNGGYWELDPSSTDDASKISLTGLKVNLGGSSVPINKIPPAIITLNIQKI